MALVRTLVVLGFLLAVATVVAGYVRYQALDTPTVEKTANDLIADEEIRNQVAATLVDQLFSNVDVPGRPRAASAAGSAGPRRPPRGGDARARGPVGATASSTGPRFQALVGELGRSSPRAARATPRRRAHQCQHGKRGRGARSPATRPPARRSGRSLRRPGRNAYPPTRVASRCFRPTSSETAQDLTQLLNNLARFLWLVPLALFAIALWLARGRRRTTLRMIAIGLTAAGLLVLLVRRVAGNYVVDHVVKNDAVRPAVGDSWDILTELLADGGWTLVGLGVASLIAVWLVGPSRSGTASRRGLAPFLARWEIAYGTAALLLFLLVLWGPTVADDQGSARDLRGAPARVRGRAVAPPDRPRGSGCRFGQSGRRDQRAIFLRRWATTHRAAAR